jgi:cell shape-determining protein MreD
MRTATIVIVAYVIAVILAAVWRFMPGFTRDAIPAIGALTAAYLGHTTRPFRAPAIAGAVILGYLIDVISGTPVAMSSLALAMTAEIARTTQQRIFVRGALMTIAYSAFIAIFASLARLAVSFTFGIPRAPTATLELKFMSLTAFSTALIGPIIWRLFRRIDAAYARTHRERDAALEGLTP